MAISPQKFYKKFSQNCENLGPKEHSAAAPKNKKMIAVSLAVIFFTGLDRFLKVLAFNDQTSQVNLLGEIIKFSYKNNYYIAFSLPLSGDWLNAVIFLIILLLTFYWLKAYWEGKRTIAICLFAIIMGAGSNLFDRLKYGFVIDYLDLKYFTVFNLTDIMIMIGVICLLFTKNYQYESQITGRHTNQ